VILRRSNHAAILATQAAAVFEERSKRLDRVDQAIAKIRSLLRRERNRELQQQSPLAERAKRIRRIA
jgi:hypothetical protein